jgi:hypothetical protein
MDTLCIKVGYQQGQDLTPKHEAFWVADMLEKIRPVSHPQGSYNAKDCKLKTIKVTFSNLFLILTKSISPTLNLPNVYAQ